MIAYVVGFMVCRESSSVALIFKTKGPPVVTNRWNGIGGKIEPGETACEAIVREFAEEAGVFTSLRDWDERVNIIGGDYRLTVMLAEVSSEVISSARTCEVETVAVWNIADAMRVASVKNNVKWLLPLAMDRNIRGPVFLQDIAA